MPYNAIKVKHVDRSSNLAKVNQYNYSAGGTSPGTPSDIFERAEAFIRATTGLCRLTSTDQREIISPYTTVDGGSNIRINTQKLPPVSGWISNVLNYTLDYFTDKDYISKNGTRIPAGSDVSCWVSVLLSEGDPDQTVNAYQAQLQAGIDFPNVSNAGNSSWAGDTLNVSSISEIVAKVSDLIYQFQQDITVPTKTVKLSEVKDTTELLPSLDSIIQAELLDTNGSLETIDITNDYAEVLTLVKLGVIGIS